MKRFFYLFILITSFSGAFAQFGDSTQLNNYIRDTIRDRRPEKVTAAQLQRALLGITSFLGNKNLFSHNLTLSELREHSLGSNALRFKFNGPYYTEDSYVAINEVERPGITILGTGDAPGQIPGIYFIDYQQPSALASVSNFLGTLSMNSGDGAGRNGNINVFPNGLNLSIRDQGGLQKSIIFSPSLGQRGILLIDTQDSIGFFAGGDYHVRGIAEHGNRWIPDVGYVKTAITEAISSDTLLNEHTATISTSSETPVTAFTIPTIIGYKYRIDVTCNAITVDGNSGFDCFSKRGFLRASGGTLSQSNLTLYDAPAYLGSLSSASFDIVSSGTNIIIRAIGEAGQSINYKFTIKIHSLNVSF